MHPVYVSARTWTVRTDILMVQAATASFHVLSTSLQSSHVVLYSCSFFTASLNKLQIKEREVATTVAKHLFVTCPRFYTGSVHTSQYKYLCQPAIYLCVVSAKCLK